MTKRLPLLALAAALAAPAGAKDYQIDPAHSSVSFKVRHMVVSKVVGRFLKLSGAIAYEKAKPQEWKAEAVIEAASIDTQVEARDKHLRAEDFLDAEKHPQITFKSKKVSAVRGDKAKLIGDLTLHGVTKPVALDLEIGGTVKDPRGNERLGATATGVIRRRDFGLTFSKTLEGGGAVVGDEVEIELAVEGIAQAQKL